MKTICILGCIVVIVGLMIACQGEKNSEVHKRFMGQKLPGVTPELFAPGFISVPDSREMGCAWMPDLKEFYFTRQRSPEDRFLWSIWVTKEVDGVWSEPEIASFSGKHIDVAPTITFDGKYMFIFRGSRKDSTIQRGTWILHRQEDNWSEPEYFDEAYMLTTADFKTFYSTSVASGSGTDRLLK